MMFEKIIRLALSRQWVITIEMATKLLYIPLPYVDNISPCKFLRAALFYMYYGTWPRWLLMLVSWSPHLSPRHNMATALQTTSSCLFSWMKTSELRQNLYWVSFLVFYWWLINNGLDNGLAPSRRQAIISTNDDPDLLCMRAPQGHE